MSDDIGKGFYEAVEGAIEGAILSALFSVFAEILPTLPYVPSYFIPIFQLIEIAFLAGSIVAIPKMESWGIGYLVGWLLGTGIMYSAGLVESWLFVVYAIVGVIALALRILGKVKL